MVRTLTDKKGRITVKYIWPTIQLTFFLIAGCWTGCGQIPKEQKTNRYQLETAIQLSLPDDVVLVKGDDGGGRDPEYEYFEWLMYSSSGFTLPEERIPHSVELVTRIIKSRKPKQKIQQPTNAFSVNWETQKFEFRGTVLQTKDGEFLLVKRFRK